MNEILDAFDKFNQKQKIGIIFLAVVIIALYPEILLYIIIIAIIYLIIKFLPNILDEYNKDKREFIKETPIKTVNRNSKFCTNCGEQIKENNKFCGNCGYKL